MCIRGQAWTNTVPLRAPQTLAPFARLQHTLIRINDTVAAHVVESLGLSPKSTRRTLCWTFQIGADDGGRCRLKRAKSLWFRFVPTLLLAQIGALLATPATAAGTTPEPNGWSVKWELEEVFPLLPQARVEALRAIRGNSPSELYAALARRWEPGMPIVADVESTAYDRTQGTYKLNYLKRAGENVGAIFRIEGLELSGMQCTWSAQVVGAKALAVPGTTPCDAPVRIEIPLGTDVEVVVLVAARAEEVVLRSKARAAQRVVVALGDSYASGEGNPDVPAVYNVRLDDEGRQGTKWPFEHDFWCVADGCMRAGVAREPGAVWWDRECHRSLVSWPVMSALWRALDDQIKHTRHVILSYACSGALVDDGGFLAQLKSKPVARNQSYSRDGAEQPSDPGQNFVYSTRRSQVNAMYDDLCRGQERRQRLVTVPTQRPVRAWVEDCQNMVAVDDLLISMGGNDLGFGSIAMGVLVASDPRAGLFNGPGLWLVRKLMGAASIGDAVDSVNKYAPHYGPSIKALMDAARADARNTSLVAYPNPVVSDKADNLGCSQRVGGDVEADLGSERVHPQRARVRDANLIMGSLLPEMSWSIIRRGWTVELKGSEVARFRDIFKAIEDMQWRAVESEGSPTRGVGLASFGTADQFNGRRMCDAVLTPDSVALPLYFCESAKLNCNVSKRMGGGEWSARSHTEWRHYPDPDRAPKRIIVNWLNDAMLAGRTWYRKPGNDEISEALGGAIHPTAEAHGGAASEIVRSWKARLQSSP